MTVLEAEAAFVKVFIAAIKSEKYNSILVLDS